MRLFGFILCFQILVFGSFAQTNLVPNPSFELFTACPPGPGQFTLATSWINPVVSSPDFFHTCSGPNNQHTPPVNSNIASILPRTGQGMAGLVPFSMPFFYNTVGQVTEVSGNYHEYISSKLTCKMEPGLTYTVSYWTSHGASSDKMASNGMGVYFSTALPSVISATVSADTIITKPTMLDAKPQLEQQAVLIAADWVHVTYTITATAAWEYMTIGNFRPVSKIDVTPLVPTALLHSYYFFDDIEVLSPPLVPVVAATPPTCAGGTNGTASASMAAGGVNYTYSWSPGGASTGSISQLGAGNYTVTVSDGACGLGSAVVQVQDPPPLALQIHAYPAAPCPGEPFVLEAGMLNGAGPYSFSWSNGNNTSQLSGVAGQSAATYSCMATDANGCQTAFVPHAVNPAPVPVADFDCEQIPNGTMVKFTNTTNGAVGSSWSVSGAAPLPQPWSGMHDFGTDGTYTMTLHTQNAAGCRDSVTKEVYVLPELVLYVPNAFTPNGDHINDVFAAKGNSVVEFDMRIYDRLGKVVFHSRDMNTGWDGTYRSQVLTNDVYVWRIEARDVFGNIINRAGHITLVR